MRLGWTALWVVSACGTVKTTSDAPRAIDARTGADTPTTIDAAPAKTAISADGISAVSIPPTTFTKIPYDHVVYDDRGELDTGNARFTAKQAGDYQICASVSFDSLVAGEIDLFVDGTRERALGHGTGGARGCRV